MRQKAAMSKEERENDEFMNSMFVNLQKGRSKD